MGEANTIADPSDIRRIAEYIIIPTAL